MDLYVLIKTDQLTVHIKEKVSRGITVTAVYLYDEFSSYK